MQTIPERDKPNVLKSYQINITTPFLELTSVPNLRNDSFQASLPPQGLTFTLGRSLLVFLGAVVSEVSSAMDSRDNEEALLVSVEDRKIRAGKSYTKDVHILSTSFLLIFLAYGAAQNLETTVNKVLDLFFLFSSVEVDYFFKLNLGAGSVRMLFKIMLRHEIVLVL